MSSNAIVALIGAIGQQHRDEACAAERRAQWDEYNARQTAAREAAAAHPQEQPVAVASRQPDEPAAAAPSRPVRRVADARPRHVRAARAVPVAVQAPAIPAVSAERRRLDYLTLVKAENAADNHCREAAMARRVLDAWNGLDAMKAGGIRAVDIEHLTTVSFDPADKAAACHGVFVTDQGARIVGTATLRRNVAGDPMFVWERDRNQDVSAYAAPPAADGGAPEAYAVRVEQASTAAALPVMSDAATLSLASARQR